MINVEEKRFLESVEVGSEFIHATAGFSGINWKTAKIVKVERLTKTQIVLANGFKLRRDNGEIVGEPSYSRTYIFPRTEEWKARMARELEAAEADSAYADALHRLVEARRVLTTEQKRALTAAIEAVLTPAEPAAEGAKHDYSVQVGRALDGSGRFYANVVNKNGVTVYGSPMVSGESAAQECGEAWIRAHLKEMEKRP